MSRGRLHEQILHGSGVHSRRPAPIRTLAEWRELGDRDPFRYAREAMQFIGEAVIDDVRSDLSQSAAMVSPLREVRVLDEEIEIKSGAPIRVPYEVFDSSDGQVIETLVQLLDSRTLLDWYIEQELNEDS